MFSVYAAELPAEVTRRVNLIKTEILNPIILGLFALAMLYFLFGVYVYVAGAENDQARITGQKHMIWGILGLVIMMSVYAIMTLICNSVQC